MNVKKTAIAAVSYAMVAALAIGGTLAYNTDRESQVNEFTVGDVEIQLNEEFEQGAELTPGKYVKKVPTITNTGANDAYVWLTVAVPTALDNPSEGQEGSYKNVLHWNCMGATTAQYNEDGTLNKSYVTNETVASKEEYLPEGITAQEINENNMTWDMNNAVDYQFTTINGEDYTVYTLLYNKAIEPGETTLPSMYQVYLDTKVDIAPNGDMYSVVNGEAKSIGWNINEDGAPKIYVNAYAIQTDETFDSAAYPSLAAHKAFVGQWGSTVLDDYAAVSKVGNETDLAAALAKGGSITITNDIVVTGTLTVAEDTVIILEGDLDASKVAGRPFEMADGASLSIVAGDNTVTVGAYGLVNVPAGADNISVQLNGGNYVGNTDNGAFIKLRPGAGDVNITLNDVTYTDSSDDGFLLNKEYYDGNLVLTVNGGYFKANAGFQTGGNTTVTGATINTNGVAFEAQGNTVIENCNINVAPGVTVSSAPAAAIAASGGGTVIVKNCVITGNMKAVLYVYSSGGTIEATRINYTGAEYEKEFIANADSEAVSDAVIYLEGEQVAYDAK